MAEDAKVGRFKCLPAREVAKRARPIDWIIPGLFARGDVCILDDGDAESFTPRMNAFALCLRMALAIARGSSFLGLPAKRHPVIYADLENGDARVDRHLRALGAHEGETADLRVVSNPRAFDALCTHVEQQRPPVLILALDPAEGSRELPNLREVAAIASKAGTGLWLLHPWARSEEIDGALFALSDGWADICVEPFGHVLVVTRDGAPGIRLLIRDESTPEMRQNVVYFIRAGGDGPIKIGASTAPRSRLASLQTANPTKLNIIAVLPGGKERSLHEKFATERLRGEWFKPSARLLDWIRGNAILWPG